MRNKEKKQTFFVLDLLLDVSDGIRRFNVEGNGFASQGLDEDLHARSTTKTKHKMESGLLLDVVISESAVVLQLFASKDETLLIRGDT